MQPRRPIESDIGGRTPDDVGELTPEQRRAILEPAVDYIESWLDGDAEQMGRCLHPDLVKREIVPASDGGMPKVDTMSRDDMVAATAEGPGRRHQRPYDAEILDAFGDIASVVLLSSVYMDYLHVGRFGDRWLIVNVLWQRRPGR